MEKFLILLLFAASVGCRVTLVNATKSTTSSTSSTSSTRSTSSTSTSSTLPKTSPHQHKKSNKIPTNDTHNNDETPTRRKITSILSQLSPIDRLERADAERCGIWTDEHTASTFLNRDDGENGERPHDRRVWSALTRRLTSLRQRKRLSPTSARGVDGTHDDERGTDGGGGVDEHPMRTDEWLVKVTLSPLLLSPGSKGREAGLFPQSGRRSVAAANGGGGTELDGDGSVSGTDSAGRRGRSQMMKFARNGYVMLMEDDDRTDSQDDADIRDPHISHDRSETKRRMTKIGKWKLDTAGISWDIPVRQPLPSDTQKHHTIEIQESPQPNNKLTTEHTNSHHKTPNEPSNPDPYPHTKSKSKSKSKSKWTVLHYHADMHLSKFQEQPRMIRGTITRDRWNERSLPFTNFVLGRHLFRPVIGTFSAEGVGEDTIDVSYKDRGFGFDTAPVVEGRKKKF